MIFSLRNLPILALALAFGLAGCSSVKKRSSSSQVATSSYDSEGSLNLNGDSDSNTAGALRTVYFGFNSASLNDSTKETLRNNADFLKGNEDVQVQIEGHCDERGGVEYNLALGERRAMTTKNYLVSMGVSSSRISTVSMGKERPVAFGHDEGAWSKNRRSNFVVTAK